MNSTAIKCILGVMFFILAGVLGYHLFPSSSVQSDLSSKDGATVIEASVEPSVKAVPQDEVEGPADRESTESAGESVSIETEPLRYIALQTQDASGDMQACLEFNAGFDAIGESTLKPFIRLSPQTPFSIDARGTRLCLLGLDLSLIHI